MANRDILLKKLKNYEECVSAIGKEAYGIIDPDTRSKLIELQTNIKELHKRIEDNRFEIAIVGLEKAGKSTFANALIGFDMLPTKEERCTYTSSCVKHAESTYAEVEFFSPEEFNERFRSNLESLGVGGSDSYSYETFTESQLNRLVDEDTLTLDQKNVRDDLEDMVKSSSEISFLLGQPARTFSENEIKENEFKNLIQNPDRIDSQYVQKPSFAVKRVTIYSNKLSKMKNCEIYDVPGFDSPTAIHLKQTKERMNQADAIILIANASKPSLTGPQVRIFNSETDLDGIPFNEKIFVFANRADESQKLDYNMRVLREELSKYGILKRSDRLIVGSAFAYLAEKENMAEEHAKQAVANLKLHNITAGIDEIKAKLEAYNNHVRIKVIEQRVENIEMRIVDIAEIIKASCGDISLEGGYSSVSHALESCDKARRKFEKSLHNYIPEVEALLVDKPLTQVILTSLETNLKPEDLFPSDEEIETLIKKSRQGVERFEVDLRKQELPKIERKFEEIISGKSDDLEEGIHDDLTEQLMDSLDVSRDHKYYEEIKALSREYVDSFFSEFNFELIHKALSLRFSSEIFEILINRPYLSQDRLDFFKEKRENIISLALYTKGVQDRIKINRSVFPENLPLINKILFHANELPKVSEAEKAACVQMTAEFIRGRINSRQAPVEDYAEAIVGWVAENDIPFDDYTKTLKATVPDIKAKKYDDDKEQEAVKHYLNLVSDKLSSKIPKDEETVKYIPLSERYSHAVRERINTHEWVVKSFKDDIRILAEVVSDSVVNAFQLELPFVTNVIGVIKKILVDIDAVDLSNFRKFYGRSYEKIEYEVFEEIRASQQKNSEKQAILNKLDEILQNM